MDQLSELQQCSRFCYLQEILNPQVPGSHVFFCEKRARFVSLPCRQVEPSYQDEISAGKEGNTLMKTVELRSNVKVIQAED